MSNKVSEKFARPARTGLQVAPAGVITEFVDAFLYDMSNRQYGALVALLTMLFAYLFVVVEHYKGSALLRESDTPKVPVTS